MNDSLFFLNIGIKNQPDKKSIILKIYLILGITGALLLFGSKVIFQLQKQGFAHNSIDRIANLGTLYIIFQLGGIILISACLAVIPFFALPGNNFNQLVNIAGWIVKIALMIAIFWLCLYKYKPMFNYELRKNALLQDLNFVKQCRKDAKENNIVQKNNVQINFELNDNKELVYKEIDSSGYFKFTDGENNIKVIFSKADFYNLKMGISGGANCYNITYYSNSHIIKSWSSNPKLAFKEGSERLCKELLDMDLEITLEVSEKGTVFIKRPYIAKYSNHDSFPPEREISLYIKKDGEFYENWGFTQKDWLNNFTSRLEKMRNDKITEPIKFEFTLVFGYDEVTGEYTPISNTIVYIVDKECIYDPHPEYESIPLEKED